jgi:heme ABC exporter ATP-binding subunit CcmA
VRPIIEDIVLEGVAKRYGAHTALHPTDLVVSSGQATLLVGANGAGKSTLLRLVAGISRPSDGRVRIGGNDLQRVPQARAAIGLLSHQTLLYDELTAWENLLFFARLYGLKHNRERLEMALAEVGLHQRGDQRTGSLSRGMKQRLALARATLHRPSILLLDEPFTGLDAGASAALKRFLHQFRQEGGTCVLVTHRLDEADGVADHLLVLQRGHLRLDRALRGGIDELQTLCAPYLASAP